MSKIRTLIVALVAILAAGAASPARADGGAVRINFIKAGVIIGGAVGSGTLTFQGRTYRLAVGGLSYGFTFGGSQTYLHGRVSNIYRPSDIEGVYGAAGVNFGDCPGPERAAGGLVTLERVPVICTHILHGGSSCWPRAR